MTSLRTRILFFFTLFATASFLAVFLSSRSTHVVGSASMNVVNNHLPMVFALGEIETALQKQDNALYRYITTGNKLWQDNCEKERVNYARWFAQAQTLSSVEIEQDKL